MNRREAREAIMASIAATDRIIARTKLRLKAMEERDDSPPASESMYWKPKGEKPQEDAPWLKDGGHSGKR